MVLISVSQPEKLKQVIEQQAQTIKDLAGASGEEQNEQMKEAVRNAVNRQAFSTAKFITDEDQLHRLCVKVYKIIFSPEQRNDAHMAKWIATYKDIIRMALNAKRNDGGSAVRVVFTLRLCRCTKLLPRIKSTFLIFCSIFPFLLPSYAKHV